MTCREVLDFLMAYLDGELTPEVRADFERHLAVCAPCVQYLESYRQTLRLERQSLAEDAAAEEPVQLPDELVRVIVQSRKG